MPSSISLKQAWPSNFHMQYLWTEQCVGAGHLQGARHSPIIHLASDAAHMIIVVLFKHSAAYHKHFALISTNMTC